MNIKEVFCVECYEWKKEEDLTRSIFSDDILYCKDCGYALVRTSRRDKK